MTTYTERPWTKLYGQGLPADITPDYPTMLDTFNASVTRAPDSAAIKVAAPAMAAAVTDRAIEVFGGMGVSDDTPLAYFYAWARSLRIVDGPERRPPPLDRSRRAQARTAVYRLTPKPWPPAGSQSGMSSGLLTTTPKRSPIAARLAACSAAAGTGAPSGPGSSLVAVALATTVGW